MSWCVAVDDVDTSDLSADGSGGPVPGLSIAEIGGTLTLSGTIPAPHGAADADRCLCGVRVVSSGTRLDDLAVVAVDLTATGVSRPEPVDVPGRADGSAGTLAFTDVRVADDDVVGERDQGWQVLQSVRARARSMRWITSLFSALRALDALADAGRSRGLADDGVFRDTLAGLHVQVSAARALAYRALASRAPAGPTPSWPCCRS